MNHIRFGLRGILVVLVLIVSPPPAWSELCRYVDAHGNMVLTDRCPPLSQPRGDLDKRAIEEESAPKTPASPKSEAPSLPASELGKNQRSAISELLADSDILDDLYQKSVKAVLDKSAYDAVFKRLARRYPEISALLPKTDARMMLCNMMDGYLWFSLALWDMPKKFSSDELAAKFLIASLRKTLLRHILEGTISPEASKLLDIVRQRGQEGC